MYSTAHKLLKKHAGGTGNVPCVASAFNGGPRNIARGKYVHSQQQFLRDGGLRVRTSYNEYERVRTSSCEGYSL